MEAIKTNKSDEKNTSEMTSSLSITKHAERKETRHSLLHCKSGRKMEKKKMGTSREGTKYWNTRVYKYPTCVWTFQHPRIGAQKPPNSNFYNNVQGAIQITFHLPYPD